MMTKYDDEDKDEQQPMWWAYRHINGGIRLKAFRGSRDALDDAYDSDFVGEVLEPFTAANRAEAEAIAKRRLSKEAHP